MEDDKKPLDKYTEEFADAVITWYKHAVKTDYTMKDLYNQLLRSATSIGANNKEAKRAASQADYKNKIAIALKEAEESRFWIDRLYKSEDIDKDTYHKFEDYLNNIIAILVYLRKNK